MQEIKSRDNKKLKFIRRIRDEHERNFLFIEGLRLAGEALRSNVKIKQILLSESFLVKNDSDNFIRSEILETADAIRLPDKIFNSISATKNPQGIILICKTPETGKKFLENKLADLKIPLLLFLYKINNPSNLGAILRTSEAAGVDGIIISEKSANIFSPKSLRSGLGANLRMPIWKEANFIDVLEWSENLGLMSTCADINSAKSYTEINWRQPRILIFGSEAHGLSAAQRKKVREQIYIPMKNDVESLNLAVSCGIILYEAGKYR